jgi:hypothetical protein
LRKRLQNPRAEAASNTANRTISNAEGSSTVIKASKKATLISLTVFD